MGFFGKLFEKKVCDLCGEEIGLLGNRKLEDGNCCKACAAKLSPWFSERRQSTVEEIRAQLQYREENKKAVAAFHATRTLGSSPAVLLDEDRGVFMVTSARDLAEANPDVIELSRITGCEVREEEERKELYREVKDEEGHTKKVSHNPPRYEYSYRFYLTIRVDHPYFDDISFQVSDRAIEIEPRFGRLEGRTVPPGKDQRREDAEYARCEALADEIRDTLLAARQSARTAPAEEPAPADPAAEKAAPAAPAAAGPMVTCPWCGASTPAGGPCTCCGGTLDG